MNTNNQSGSDKSVKTMAEAIQCIHHTLWTLSCHSKKCERWGAVCLVHIEILKTYSEVGFILVWKRWGKRWGVKGPINM